MNSQYIAILISLIVLLAGAGAQKVVGERGVERVVEPGGCPPPGVAAPAQGGVLVVLPGNHSVGGGFLVTSSGGLEPLSTAWARANATATIALLRGPAGLAAAAGGGEPGGSPGPGRPVAVIVIVDGRPEVLPLEEG